MFCEDAIAEACGAMSVLPVLITVMVTVAGPLLLRPSVTTSWKVRVAGLDGAVKVGLTAVAGEGHAGAAGLGPLVVGVLPPGSLLADPSSCTVELTCTV